MNTATTSPLGIDFTKQLALSLINTVDEATKQFARTAWTITTSFLLEHWFFVMGGFILLLLFFLLKAVLGQWGSLYSLTYWTLYAVIVFIIGLIWGPDALVSDIFHVVYIAAIWPICYWATSWIWDRFGFRKVY